MPRVKVRERPADSRIDRIQDAFKTGGLVEGFAEGVSRRELQSMRKAFIKGYLQRVVGGISDRILREDAAEDWNAVSRTTRASQRITLWGGIATKADQRDAVWGHTTHRSS